MCGSLVIVLDVNLLLCTVISGFPQHSRAHAWWEQAVNRPARVGLTQPDAVCSGGGRPAGHLAHHAGPAVGERRHSVRETEPPPRGPARRPARIPQASAQRGRRSPESTQGAYRPVGAPAAHIAQGVVHCLPVVILLTVPRLADSWPHGWRPGAVRGLVATTNGSCLVIRAATRRRSGQGPVRRAGHRRGLESVRRGPLCQPSTVPATESRVYLPTSVVCHLAEPPTFCGETRAKTPTFCGAGR